MDGFETIFAFQLDNAAQLCKKVKELVFGVTLYEHCALTGSDGFALVLRGGDEVAALGRGGGSLGYGGLISSLAIEFDTWANDDMGDVAYNHVAVQAGGPGRPVGAEKEEALKKLAEDEKHAAMIVQKTQRGKEARRQTSAIVAVASRTAPAPLPRPKPGGRRRRRRKPRRRPRRSWHAVWSTPRSRSSLLTTYYLLLTT